MKKAPTTWSEKVTALQAIPNVALVKMVDHFTAPNPGTFFELDGSKYLITKSQSIDGVVFGVSRSRSQCLVAIELPGESAVAVVAKSPTVLEMLVPQVFETLGSSFALCTN